jgi:nitroreductase
MTRSFLAEPVPAESLERVLDAAHRAPSAGSTKGVAWQAFQSEDERGRMWRAVCEVGFLAEPGDLAGLLHAGALLLPVADPSAYIERYGRPDKASSGLAGLSVDEWPVPYWIVDAAFAVMCALLAAENEGLGALFFRLHRPVEEVLESLGIPAGRVLIGAVALGVPAPKTV